MGVAMRRFLGISGSIVLAFAIANVGIGKAPVGGITVAPGGQALAADMPAPPPPPVVAPVGKGKAPIGKGKGKGPPPPVITKG
jgi:hypothetical protein